MASMPLKGSMRQPKLEALQPASTGGIVGMSFFFTLASNNCDSRIPRESLRFSICLESWSSCRLNSAMERSLGGMLDTAPPRPGASLKRNSPGLSPARVDKRSPSASRRMSWACIWPSFTAIAFRFSRRNSSVLRRWASCADKTSESSSGSLNSVAWRTVIQKSASVRLNRRSAMNMAPAIRCRLVRVQDLDLANLLETRIICMLPPPGAALYTSYAYAYEEPLRLLESARRHRSPHAAGAALDRVARDSRSRTAGIPRAMLLDRKLQAGKSRYFCCQRRDRCQTETYAPDIIGAAF